MGFARSREGKGRGAFVDNNAAGNFRTAGGGTIESQKVRISSDVMRGTFTATAGTVTTVNNANVRTLDQIDIRALDGDAAALDWFISSLSPGVSFNVTFTSAAAGTEEFAYELN